MDNDLISREALKNELNSRLFPQDYSTTLLLGVFNELIDNAPTVPQINIFCEKADETAIDDMKAELQSVIEERTQGEWEPDIFGFTCNKCRWTATVSEDVIVEYHFCPNCGADMRKGGAE